MKRTFLLFAALVSAPLLLLSLQIVQAHPSAHDAPQTTTTPSATPSETATGTATATTNPCDGRPAAPEPIGPKDKSTLKGTVVTFRWNSVECAKKYRIVVRRGAKDGPLVFRDKTRQTRTISPALARGYIYFWYVKACAPLCARSKTWTFKIEPPPTPRPTTPVPTSQATPPPNGTPVPGTPPSQIAVYKGDGAYLNTDPNNLYRFECSLDSNNWLHGVRQGQAVYNIALWYYPNEQITYQRMDFNLSQIVETGTLRANSSGYVELAVDTSTWTPDHHYHLIFTGKSSSAKWCGHFDVVANTNASETHPLVAHSHADIERVYRAAGLEPPR